MEKIKSSRRLGRGLDFLERRRQALLRMPEIISRLHIEIELRIAAGEPAKAQCHIGGDRALTFQNGVKRWPADPHTTRRLGFRQFEMLDQDLEQQCAGMGRRPLEREPDGIFGRRSCLSGIVPDRPLTPCRLAIRK